MQDKAEGKSDSLVLVDVVDGVAWITMNRPEVRNAQNIAMTHALDDAEDEDWM